MLLQFHLKQTVLCLNQTILRRWTNCSFIRYWKIISASTGWLRHIWRFLQSSYVGKPIQKLVPPKVVKVTTVHISNDIKYEKGASRHATRSIGICPALGCKNWYVYKFCMMKLFWSAEINYLCYNNNFFLFYIILIFILFYIENG